LRVASSSSTTRIRRCSSTPTRRPGRRNLAPPAAGGSGGAVASRTGEPHHGDDFLDPRPVGQTMDPGQLRARLPPSRCRSDGGANRARAGACGRAWYFVNSHARRSSSTFGVSRAEPPHPDHPDMPPPRAHLCALAAREKIRVGPPRTLSTLKTCRHSWSRDTPPALLFFSRDLRRRRRRHSGTWSSSDARASCEPVASTAPRQQQSASAR
jgi:hypothetical protein